MGQLFVTSTLMTLADNLWVCVWTPGFAVRSGIVLPLDLDISWNGFES